MNISSKRAIPQNVKGSIYNYLCNQCLSPLTLWVWILLIPYLIKFVSDLQQVSGFLRVLQFPPPIKLTATI